MLNAREVPMPCAPMPMAKPRCHQAFMPSAFRINGAKMAPRIPVVTAKIAVKVGDTLIRSAIPMAIGAVTDLGYMAPVMLESAPNNLAILTALMIDTKPPATKEANKGNDLPLRLLSPLYIGIANETVAEPNKK